MVGISHGFERLEPLKNPGMVSKTPNKTLQHNPVKKPTTFKKSYKKL
jgi:hypothetical protein